MADPGEANIWQPRNACPDLIADPPNEELTVASMAAHTTNTYVAGDVIRVADYYSGLGGAGTWVAVLTSGVTPNAMNIVVGTGIAANQLISFVLRLTDVLHPKQWGLYANNTNITINDAVLEALKTHIISFSAGSRPVIRLPSGIIAYQQSPALGCNSFSMIGPGPDNCVFMFSGVGDALDISSGTGSNRSNLHLEGFSVDIGATADNGLYLADITHSLFKDINTVNGKVDNSIHFEINSSSNNVFENIGSPLRLNPVRIHLDTIRLRQGSHNNTFINVLTEGANNRGVFIVDGNGNTFIGGASNNNTGQGLKVDSFNANNTFIGFSTEGNTEEDIEDQGHGTVFINCTSKTPIGSLMSGFRSQIIGGYWEALTVDAGGDFCTVKDIIVNKLFLGGFINAGTDTTMSGIYDEGNFSFINTLKSAKAAITVGSSPFTYKNPSNQARQVVVKNGTISDVTWKRAGDTVQMGGSEGGNVNGRFWLAPDDELVVTYSSAPTMDYIPMGVVNL